MLQNESSSRCLDHQVGGWTKIPAYLIREHGVTPHEDGDLYRKIVNVLT